jgi:SAM-dependent methyltransferase
MATSPDPSLAFVPETRFGVWFLTTAVWRIHVLGVALDSLQALAPELPRGGTILDIGTGLGHSLGALAERFQPERIHALDPDPAFPAKAATSLAACPVPVTVHRSHAEAMDLPDASVDLVFCHQSLHHIVGQEQALGEMFRVLKPGGHLLLAESTRRYIRSWIIRPLFRHPMQVQRTAPQYLDLLRAAGFQVQPDRVQTPYLWWSRPDLGFLEWIGRPVPAVREETLLNVVACKP